MDLAAFERHGEYEWHIPRAGKMRVPGVIFGDAALIADMDDKVGEQVRNVAMLPGIVGASYAMPDAHWGYGFPIGGVAAFDAAAGGVVSAGGVGFDVSCGVRTMLTGLTEDDVAPAKEALANALFAHIPAGVGSRGQITLDDVQMDAMLAGGARWAVEQGYGEARDFDRIEEHGCVDGARPKHVSAQARKRQRKEMGTLGSGNHYLEVQVVDAVYDADSAAAFGLAEGDAVVSIHCGSRGLGHQIGTEYLREMVIAAADYGIELPDRELACAPILSRLGERYLGAMRSAINCALANREIIGHLTREVFTQLFPHTRLDLLFDVSHNTCKAETHEIESSSRQLFVHRKGATRAYGPNHPDLPAGLRPIGQPVLIGGTMGTESWVLVGTAESEAHAFSSACHGAGRSMSRRQALKRWSGRAIVDSLGEQGIIVRSPSMRGVAEEAPGAYKNVREVAEATEKAGLARRVARMRPIICIKG